MEFECCLSKCSSKPGKMRADSVAREGTLNVNCSVAQVRADTNAKSDADTDASTRFMSTPVLFALFCF